MHAMSRPTIHSDPEILKLFTKVNMHSSTAAYVQFENQVIFAVTTGKLKPGQQLPSVRELSEVLLINPITVNKAIRNMEVMGILYTRKGKGIFIAKEALIILKDHCWKYINRKTYEIVQEARCSGMAKTEVMNIVKECIKSEAGPYSEVPRELLKAYKSK